MAAITLAYDAIAANVGSLPPGQACGYTTGSGGIAWDSAMWSAHPGAVRIDQDSVASDGTADILDVERGAATPADCGPWAKRALAAFRAATRPGQRTPGIYCSASNVSSVVNALNAAGVTSGVGLWIADWNWTQAQAVQEVLAAAGPFPIIGAQFADAGNYDIDVFATAWLDHVSGTPAPPPPGNYHFSATPHVIINASWDVVEGAGHYVATFTPQLGEAVSVRLPQPATAAIVRVAGLEVPSMPGTLVVNAIVNAQAVLVGSHSF